jgi:hypothetical protein
MTERFDEFVTKLNEVHGLPEDTMTAVATVPYDIIAQAVLEFLVEEGQLDPGDTVYDIDLNLPVNDDGLVEFDLEFKPGGPLGNQ